MNTLIKYFNYYKFPEEVTFDAGTDFNNNLVKQLLKIYGIKPYMTCAANPKSNGILEKFHSMLIEHLRILNQKAELKNINFENKLNLAIMAYNDSINQITKLTPNEILYGKTKNISPFAMKEVNEDYVNDYKNQLKILHENVKTKILNEKVKGNKIIYTLPQQLPIR